MVEEVTVALYGDYPAEGAFEGWGKKVAPKRNYKISVGQDVIDKLKEASKTPPDCCIKKLFIFHHAYEYRQHSGTYRRYGYYPDSAPLSTAGSAEDGFMKKKLPKAKEGAADISDLEKALKDKDIRFCDPCSIVMTGCRMGETGVPAALAKATGCTVTAAHGASSPEVKNDKETGKWKSGPKYSEERQKEPYTGWTEYDPGGTTKNIGDTITVW